MRKLEGKGLTVVGVVEVDDFLPAVVSHRIDDSAMVIRSHTYSEVQETRGRCQDLKRYTIIRAFSTFPLRLVAIFRERFARN